MTNLLEKSVEPLSNSGYFSENNMVLNSFCRTSTQINNVTGHFEENTNKLSEDDNSDVEFNSIGNVEEVMNSPLRQRNVSPLLDTKYADKRENEYETASINNDSLEKTAKSLRGVIYLKNGVNISKHQKSLDYSSDEENEMHLSGNERSDEGKRQMNNDFKQLSKLEASFNMYLRNSTYMISNFKVVFDVCVSIQNSYLNIILSHFNWSIQKRFDLRLWRSVFYKAINFYRKQACKVQLNLFIDNCVQFYKKMIKEFGFKYNFSSNDIPYFETRVLENNVLIAVQRCLIILGDLSRYKYKTINPKSFKIAFTYYSNASKVIPIDPKPYYLLSILFFSNDNYLTTLYYLYKCLKCCCSSTNSSTIVDNAREELTSLYEKLRRKIPSDFMDCEKKSSKRRFEVWKFSNDITKKKLLADVEPLTILTYMHCVLFLNIGMEVFDRLREFILEELKSVLSSSDVNKMGQLLNQITFISAFASKNDFSHKATRSYALDFMFDLIRMLQALALNFLNADENEKATVILASLAYYINWICENEVDFDENVYCDFKKIIVAALKTRQTNLVMLPCVCPTCSILDAHKTRNYYTDKENLHFMEVVFSFVELMKPKYAVLCTNNDASFAKSSCCELDDYSVENENTDEVEIENGENTDEEEEEEQSELCASESSAFSSSSNVLAQYRRFLCEKADSFNRRKNAVIGCFASRPVTLNVNPKYLIVDTNCLISHLHSLKSLSEHFTLIIPLVVYLELHQIIRTKLDDLHRCALNSLEWLNEVGVKNQKVKIVNTDGTVVVFLDDNVNDACSRSSKAHSNDDLILLCCVNLSKKTLENDRNVEVVLLTGDRNLRLKAHARKIPSRNVPEILKEIKK